MITEDLLENRIKNFWGYGNLNSKIWFIGIEEGFDGNMDELERRFNRTKDKSVIDIQGDMKGVPDHIKWFSNRPSLQRTWSKLILILLSLESEKNIDNEKIRAYQKHKFGRLNSNHCSLEFMPLPCPSIKSGNWFYEQFNIDYLKSRKNYIEKIMPKRISLFKKLINDYNPKLVVFYSLSYLEKWKIITDQKFLKKDDYYFYISNKTKFFIIPHPTAHGMTNFQWKGIATGIKNKSIQ